MYFFGADMSDLIIAQDTESLLNNWLEAELKGEKFPVPFDLAWQIAGYSRKDNGKRKLEKELIEGEDFAFLNLGEWSQEGRSSDLIGLSCDGFKHFCLLAKTEQGRRIRQYFIEAEKKWKIVKQQFPEVANRVEDMRRLELTAQIERDRTHRLEVARDIATMHGKQYGALALGGDKAVVEVEKSILEVIDKRCGDRRKGMTDAQLNEYLKQKTGFKFKSGKALTEYLETYAPELLDVIQRPITQRFVHFENIDKAMQVLSKGDRQMLLGE
jgi:phage anti-repressor protein